MKKVKYILPLLFIISIIFTTQVIAYADTRVSTDIFSPDDYLQFCDLNSPVAYAFDKDASVYVIAESKRFVIYKNGKFTTKDLSATDYNVDDVRIYKGKYLLFTSVGRLYYANLDTLKIDDKGLVQANYFDVLGDLVVTASGNSFIKATLNENGDSLSATTVATLSKDKAYNSVSIVSKDEWLCVNEGALYKISGTDTVSQIASSLNDVRYGSYHDGYYYFTSSNGVGSVNVSTGAVSLLKSTQTELKLGNVCNPKGIRAFGDKIYLTDASLNAVSEFTLDGKFTGFAITTRSDGAGRVSSQTEDIQVCGDVLYALDGNAIKTFKDKENGIYKLPVNGPFKGFSVIDSTALLTTGSDLYAADLNDLTNASDLSIVTLDGSLSVTAITSFANDFYFVNNTVDQSSNLCADVYKISVDKIKAAKSESGEQLKAEKITRIMGRGDDICTDIFGRLYLLIYKDAKYSVVAFYDEGSNNRTEVTDIYSVSNESDRILSIVVDFECNVYALQLNNKVVRISDDLNTENFYLNLSDNFPASASCKDLTVVPATDKIYALYDGFILTVNPADLKVSSPQKISVPDSYKNQFSDQISLCSLKERTRYFEVDLLKTQGEFFDYAGYSTYTGKDGFVVLYSDERYSLIANDKLSCIVRTKDIISRGLNQVESNEELYACANGYIYTAPVLTEYFRCGEVLENQKVSVRYVFEFNGVKFAIASYGDSLGYIPYSMLKTSVALTESPLTYSTLTVSRLGTKVYAEKELLTEIGSLKAFESIKVYEKTGNVYKIEYEGTYGYILADDAKPKGQTVVRNLLLCVIPFIALVVTVIFIYRRKYVKED